MFFLKKIKAGALQYVLVVSVIITITIMAFISLLFLQQKMTVKHQLAKQTITNTQLGFQHLKRQEIEYNQKTTLGVLPDSQGAITAIKKHWGIFDVSSITSIIGKESFHKTGLMGVQNPQRDALYIKDNYTALVLVGKTSITGNASLPSQGVKTGNIAGVSYYGNQLIKGNQKTSIGQLPAIKNLDHLQQLTSNTIERDYEEFDLTATTQRHQSFDDKILLYQDYNAISLEDISLSGQVLILSKIAITVTPSAKLEDVILIAPTINILPDVSGNFQAIATKNITLGSNSTLEYPSALVVLEAPTTDYNPQASTNTSQIVLKKQSHIKGVVVYVSQDTNANYKTQLEVQPSASITGEVYCTKNLELQGNVIGSVYTHGFIAKQSGGVYINHIYNGVINNVKLPKQYVGLLIGKESNTVAKWVH